MASIEQAEQISQVDRVGRVQPAELISLGQTNVRISPLGVGAMTWGDRWGGMYGGRYRDADAEAAFGVCRAAGLTLFDTAELYSVGRAERVLGRCVRTVAAPAAGTPVIATKIMPFPWRLSPGSLQRALQGSLRRLGLAQVDLYQLHWPGGPMSIERWMNAMADAVETGLVRAVGVSNYDAGQMRRAHAALARRGLPLASNQVQYSLLHRHPERDGVLATCRDLGVTLIAYTPLHMGLLTGKYTPERPPRGLMRRLRPELRPARLARIQPLVAYLRQVGEAHSGKTPTQVALNWLMRKGALPIPGVRDARQARDLPGALGWQLHPAEVAALDAAADAVIS